MGALFDDANACEHQDAVGMADGGETVSDDQGGSAVGEIEQRLLNRPFALVVERAGCLVEDQDRRILEESARYREALPLAARKLDTALADIGRVAIWQSRYEVVSVGGTGGGLHLGIGRVRPAVAKILRHGAGKEIDVLLHDPDMSPQ